MALDGQGTFVGFGFGPIQAGLFALEAYRSGAYRHLVIAEIAPEIVAALRGATGKYTINIAYPDRVEVVRIGPVRAENPAVAADRSRLVEAVAAAHEIATAVPTVRAYKTPGPASLHHILAEGLQRKAALGGPRALVYAAENATHAAAHLRAAVMEELNEAERAAVDAHVAFVDTVIGKMSGIMSPPQDLAPVTPGGDRAFLVEDFNRILISRPDFGPGAPPFDRGIRTFIEKDDLLPFEEAKLYGHNAVHALAAYLGRIVGLTTLDQLPATPGLLAFLRAALLEESGAGLIHRYGEVDPFFTPHAYAAAADDLLARMVNPHLRDTVARVGRDPARKLDWDDRLIGAMRLALEAGVTPHRYALGVAAALDALDPQADPGILLPARWGAAQPDPGWVQTLLGLVHTAVRRLAAWRGAGCPDLSAWWAAQVAPVPSGL